MSKTVDDRIVALQFENDQFEEGVSESLKTLDKLKNSLKLDDAAKSLGKISNVAKDVDLSPIEKAVDALQEKLPKKLSTLRLALSSAIGNLFGGLMKDLVIDPIGQAVKGGITRSQNIADAKFQLEGLGVAWNAISDDIDYAVKGTAYGFDAAAKAASQLSASGIQVGDSMKVALRGISGVAAMSSSEYEEISPIFTKIAGNGRMMADELNRISAKGLNAAATLADFFNNIDQKKDIPKEVADKVKTLTKGLKVTEKDIREFASDSQIDFQMFSYAMDDAFGAHAKDANRTFSGALANMKASLSRIGQAFREPIMDAARDVFNGLREMIDAIKQTMIDTGLFDIWSRLMYASGTFLTDKVGKITKFLKEDFKGAANIGKGLKNILYSIVLIIDTLGKAIKSVFSRESSGSFVNGLNNASEGFEKWSEKLIPTQENLQKLFDILTKGLKVVKAVFSILKFAGVTIFSGITLGLEGIKKLLTPVINAFSKFGSILKDVYTKSSNIKDFFINLKNTILGFIPALNNTRSGMSGFGLILESVGEKIKFFAGIVTKILFGAVGLAIMGVIKAFEALKNFSLAGLISSIKSFVDNIKSIPQVATAIENFKIIFANLKIFFDNALLSIQNFFSKFRKDSGDTTRSVNNDMSLIQKVITGVTNAFKILGAILGGIVLGAITAFNKAFDFIRNFSFERVISSIKAFVASVKEMGLLETIAKTFENTGGIIGRVLRGIVDKFKSFVEEIKGSGSIFEFLVDKLKGFGEHLIAFKEKLAAAFFGDDVTRGMGGSKWAQFIDTLKDKFTNLKTTVGAALDYIKDKGYLTKTLMVIWTAGILKSLMNFASGTKTIAGAMAEGKGMFSAFGRFGDLMTELTKTVQYARNPMKALTDAMAGWNQAYIDAHKKTAAENFAAVLKSMAVAIGVMAASLAILYKVVDDVDKFKTIAAGLGIFVGVMVIIAGAMTILSAYKTVDNSFFSSFAANMIGMSLAIAVLSGAVKKLSDIEQPNLTRGILALTAILFLFTVVRFALSKIEAAGAGVVLSLKGIAKLGGKLAMGVAAFTLIGVSLLLMAAAIKKIKDLKLATDAGAQDDLIAGLVYIGSIFMAVIAASKYCNGMTKGVLQISGALALLGLAANELLLVTKLMKFISLPELGKMGLAFAGLSAIFVLVARFTNTKEITKSVIGLGITFTLLANTLLKLELAAKIMEHIDFFAMLRTLGFFLLVIGGVCAVVESAAKLKNGQTWKPIVAMLVGLTMVMGMLIVLSLMVGNDKVFHDLLKAAALLGAIMVAYGYVLQSAGKLNGKRGTASIIAILVSFGAIFAGLYALMPYVQNTKDIVKIAAVAAILDLAVLGLVKIAQSFLKFAKDNKLGNGKWVLKSMAALGIMVAAFAVVAATLVLTSRTTKWSELLVTAAALTGAILALSYAAKVILESTKKLKWDQLGKAAASLGLMIGAIAVIGLIFVALTKFTQSTDIASMAISMVALYAIAGLIFVVGEVFKSIGKITPKQLSKAAIVMGLLVGTFLVIGLVIAALAVLVKDAGTALKNSQVVALVMTEILALAVILGAARSIVSKATSTLPVLLALVGIYTVIGIIMVALGLVKADPLTVLKNSQIISLVMLEIVAFAAILGALVSAGIGALANAAIPALLALVAAYAVIGLVIAILSAFKVDPSTALKNSQIVALVLLEIVALTAILGLLSPLAAAATAAIPGLLLVTVAFGVLALVIAAINTFDFGEDINAKLQTLMTVLLALVGITAVLGLLSMGAVGEVAGAAAILLLAAALVPLANGLKALEGVNYDSLGDGLKVIAAGLALLIAAGIAGAIAGAGFIVLAAGIAAVGLACMVAGAGVLLLTAGLSALIAVLASVATILVDSVQGAFEGFKEKLEKFKTLPADIIQALIDGLADAKDQLVKAGREMGESLVQSFRDSVGWHSPPKFLVDFFNDCGVTVNEKATGVEDLFEGTGEDWGSALQKSLTYKMENFDLSSIGKSLGINLGDNFALGAIPGIESVEEALASLGLATSSYDAKLTELNRKVRTGAISGQDYAYQLKQLNGQTKTSTALLGDLGDMFSSTGSKAKGGAGGVKDFGESLKSTLESQMNIFQKFEQKAAMSKEELLGNMRSQIEGMANWAAQMQQLATMGIDKGLYQKLAEMGPQGAEYVGAFASMTAEELQEANTLWAQSLVLPGQTAAMISGSFNGIGTNMQLGLQKGWDSKQGATNSMIQKDSEEWIKTAENTTGVQSPSWKMESIGRFMVMGLQIGIEKNQKLAIDAMDVMCQAIVMKAEKILDGETFASFGANIVNGLTAGLNDEEANKKLNGAVASLSERVKSKFTGKEEDDGMEIESPSKVFYRYGKFIDLGLANGIDAYSGKVISSTGDLADSALEAMRYTVANIASMINDEMEDPVITPILDLSNVQAGVRTLNNVLAGNKALMAGGVTEEMLQNGKSPIGGTTFIQNNYSPKALSRADIYRQTRNQFAQYKQQMG